MEIEESKESRILFGFGLGLNPSRATRQTLSNFLRIEEKDVLYHQKTGVFVPGFNGREYERLVTVLNPGIEVLFGPHPDCIIISPNQESEKESSPFSPSQNGELCM